MLLDYLLKVYDENTPNDVKGIEQVAELFYNNGFYEKLFIMLKKQFQIHDVQAITSKIDNILKIAFAIKAIKNPIDFDAKIWRACKLSMTEYVNAITVDAKKLLFTRRWNLNKNRDQEDLFVYDNSK